MRQELMSGQFVNRVIADLPIATESKLFREDQKPLIRHKAIVVNDQTVSVVSKFYKLVQHEEAFRPVIEGITVAGVQNFDFMAVSTLKDAKLNIFVGSASDGTQGIKYGFRISNSFDGKSAIKFDMKMSKHTQEIIEVKHKVVTVWGYRLACQNGMIMRVPLEYHEIVRPEIRERVEHLISEGTRILHNAAAVDKIKQVGLVVEAFMLLREPLELMVKQSQNIALDWEKAKDLIEKYVSKRRAEKIYDIYHSGEDFSLWGLYNAATFFATHKVKNENGAINIMASAADLMQHEVLAKIRQPKAQA